MSLAGFAVMNKRLNAIEGRLNQIGIELSAVTGDRRDDELHDIFAEIGSDLQQVDLLWTLKTPERVAAGLQLTLARNGHKLNRRFLQAADLGGKDALPLAAIDRLWSLAAAIRLTHEAVAKTLFVADELAAARTYTQEEASRQIALMRTFAPEPMSRLVARREKQPEAARQLRRTALEQCRLLSDGLRGGTTSLMSQSDLAKTLMAQGVSGRAFLQAAHDEE